MMKQFSHFFIFLLLSCFLLGYTYSFAQGWEQHYGEDNQWEYSNSVTKCPNSDYIFVGQTNGSAIAVRINNEGEKHWLKEFDLGHLNDIKRVDGGGYIAAGSSYHSSDSSQAFVLHLNEQGDTLWTSHFGNDDTHENILSFCQTEDHHFLTVGYQYYTNDSSQLYVAKIDASGNLLHQYSEGNGRFIDIHPMQNNRYLAVGAVPNDENEYIKNYYLAILDTNGNIIDDKVIDIGGSRGFSSILATANETFTLLGSRSNELAAIPYLYTIDTALNVLSIDTLIYEGDGYLENISSFAATSDNGYLITGTIKHSLYDQQMYAMKLSEDKNIIWQQHFGNTGIENGTDIMENNIGGAFIIGSTTSFNLTTSNFYVVNTDIEGNSFLNKLEGNVYYDVNHNCSIDSLDIVLDDWLVKIKGEETYYTLTDSTGNYFIRLDTGQYEVELVVPNIYWELCADNIIDTIRYDSLYQNDTINFAVQAQYECPILKVDIGTPFLRRCFENSYTVQYCNEGTSVATDAHIEIQFDEFLSVQSSSIPHIINDENSYIFEVGTVAIGDCNNFTITTLVDCDNTILGQTHCVEAHIYPDSICLPPNTDWDGSSIKVEGYCETDSVAFRIQNVGSTMLNDLQYIVIQDEVLLRIGNFQLDANEDFIIKEEANGATYHIDVEQALGHPGNSMPSVTIEGCDGFNNTGLVTQYSEDDADPFVDIHCQENIGSFDPNDKQAFPTGQGVEHTIVKNETELDYLIRFQNTGTDTAFTVIVKDTLSPFLDITTIEAGSSSHSYELNISNQVLTFRFENIMLPDSNINEVASHGFVKFKVAQVVDNPIGAVIYNDAAIYFDFNEPVITNEVFHTIKNPVYYGVDTLEVCSEDSIASYIDSLIFENYDSLTYFEIELLPTIFTEQEIEIEAGSFYNDIIIHSDTTLHEIYSAVNGCDSLVETNLLVENTINTFDKNTNASLSLFPNPVKNELYLQVEGTLHDFTIELYSSFGQRIFSKHQKASEGTILLKLDTSILAKGSYIVLLKNDHSQVYTKFVKLE